MSVLNDQTDENEEYPLYVSKQLATKTDRIRYICSIFLC